MQAARCVLLVDGDEGCGQALAALLRRQGDRVHLVQTRGRALQASRRRSYDVAIVDLFVEGGGVELARVLARRVPRLVLSLGARLVGEEILEAALGFPVLRKTALPALLRGRGASSNGTASGARRRGSRPLSLASNVRARELHARRPGRARRSAPPPR